MTSKTKITYLLSMRNRTAVYWREVKMLGLEARKDGFKGYLGQ